MEKFEVLLISISLAMDAFAVSVCKGLSMKKMNWEKAIIIFWNIPSANAYSRIFSRNYF